MHRKVGEVVYYPQEFRKLRLEVKLGVCRVEDVISKTSRVAGTEILHSLSPVKRADTDEAGLAAIREQNSVLMTKRNSLLYQLEALKKEVMSRQKKKEVMSEQLQPWRGGQLSTDE